MALNTIFNTLGFIDGVEILETGFRQNRQQTPDYGYGDEGLKKPVPREQKQQDKPIDWAEEAKKYFGGFKPSPGFSAGGGIVHIGPDGKPIGPEPIPGAALINDFITTWGFNIVLVAVIAGGIWALQTGK